MAHIRRFFAAHLGLLAAIALISLVGASVAFADAVTSTKGRPATSAVTHAKAGKKLAAKRARLVASKLRYRRTAHKAATSGLTYPDQGVSVYAPSSQGQSEAAASPLSTPAAAIAAFQQDPAATSAFGSALTASTPTASLATVTEQNPVVSGVSVGVPYQAWVVRVQGPVNFYGGPGSTPPPAGTQCDDVGIYDLLHAQWSELIQSC